MHLNLRTNALGLNLTVHMSNLGPCQTLSLTSDQYVEVCAFFTGFSPARSACVFLGIWCNRESALSLPTPLPVGSLLPSLPAPSHQRTPSMTRPRVPCIGGCTQCSKAFQSQAALQILPGDRLLQNSDASMSLQPQDWSPGGKTLTAMPQSQL